MKRRNAPKRKIAKEMTDKEMQAQLTRIGKLIREKRKEQFPSADDFAYQIGIARSNMNRHEKGNDMYLTTFLRIVTGLGISAQDFFRDLEK